MSEKGNQETGDSLERAVAAIEASIVKDNPALASCNHTIETKKRVQVAGVTHELDVYVAYDFTTESASFVFECKNRKRKAAKDDILILAEKVEAVAAQRGYLVARGFTPGAVAQAKLTRGRIVLVEATDYLGEGIPFPKSPVTSHGPIDPQFSIALIPNRLLARPFAVPNQKIPPELFRNLNKRCNELLKAHVAELVKKGIEGRSTQKFRHMEPIPRALVDGMLIQAVVFEIAYTFANERIPSRINARFDIPGRGKYIEIEFEHPQKGRLRFCFSASAIPDEQKRK